MQVNPGAYSLRKYKVWLHQLFQEVSTTSHRSRSTAVRVWRHRASGPSCLGCLQRKLKQHGLSCPQGRFFVFFFLRGVVLTQANTLCVLLLKWSSRENSLVDQDGGICIVLMVHWVENIQNISSLYPEFIIFSIYLVQQKE